MVVAGLHGLQLYANRYWYQHLLSHLSGGMGFPHGLLAQIYKLRDFRKEGVGNSVPLVAASGPPELCPLNNIPEIKSMVSEMIDFRANMKDVS